MPCRFKTAAATKSSKEKESYNIYKITFFEKYEVKKIVSYGSKPSSRGSHVSVMSVECRSNGCYLMETNNYPMQYNKYTNSCQKKYHYAVENQSVYDKEAWKTFISSTIVTVLLITISIALNTISDEPFS